MSSLSYYDRPSVADYFQSLKVSLYFADTAALRGMPPDKAAAHVSLMIRSRNLLTDAGLEDKHCDYSPDQNGDLVIVLRETSQKIDPAKVRLRPRGLLEASYISLDTQRAIDAMGGPSPKEVALAAAVIDPITEWVDRIAPAIKAGRANRSTFEPEIVASGIPRDVCRTIIVPRAYEKAGVPLPKRRRKAKTTK